jgi:hypothetical protein
MSGNDKSDSGTIQHTSFMNKEPQEDDKPGTRSFPITDPLLIQKLDSLSPEEMENLQKILVESMKELREKHSVKIGNGLDEPKELKP